MRTVDATEAQAGPDEILEDAQRQPILIRRQDQAIAVVVSIMEYGRLRALNIQAFLALRKEVPQEAASSGLTEETLADLTGSESGSR
jgi:hypothetical protein